MSGDMHSPAYFLNGRAVFNLNRSRTIGDLSVADPAAVLDAAQAEIAAAIESYIHAPASDARRGALALAIQELMAGAESVRRGAARNADWADAFGPLHAASVSFLGRQSFLLVRDRWQDVQRLARTLLLEKSMTAATARWILNVKRPALAASFSGRASALRR